MIVTQPIRSVTVVVLENVILTCSASVDQAAYSWHGVSGPVVFHHDHKDRTVIHLPFVTGFTKTDLMCTFSISRNTDLKY